MSQENVELVQRAYEHFRRTGDFSEEFIDRDYVWDLSHYTGWPEEQTYHGIDGARRFMIEWIDSWDDWEWEVESLHEAGDKVVSVLHQSGRSKATSRSPASRRPDAARDRAARFLD